MANHASALKAHRQSLQRRSRNRANRASLRTALKSFARLLDAGKPEEAGKELATLYARVDQAVRKGVLPKNAAARQKSRLTRRLNVSVARRAGE